MHFSFLSDTISTHGYIDVVESSALTLHVPFATEEISLKVVVIGSLMEKKLCGIQVIASLILCSVLHNMLHDAM